MGNSNIYSIIANSASQQDSYVRSPSLELTGEDTFEMIISKLKKCPTKSLTTLTLSEINITNETLELCSRFVNPKRLYLYQCTFVNPEINLEKYLGLKSLILTFTYSDSLNLKNLRIKSCKGFNIWKIMDSALAEIV
jgi:hypothetical protein